MKSFLGLETIQIKKEKIFPILFTGITLITVIITSCNNDDDQKPRAEKIILDKEHIELKTGETANIKASVEPAEADQKLIYQSSDEKVATADEKGTITAVSAGEVEIKVSSESEPEITAVCKVLVKKSLAGIPDAKFRSYLKETIPKAFPDGGDKINPGYSTLAKIKILDVSDKEIKSLTGIQYFTGLEELNCSKNALDTLDLTGNTALTRLDCSENHSLKELNIKSNQKLLYIYCDENKLTTLDLSHNKALKHLVCSNNQLQKLDLKNNTALAQLTCPANELKELNLTQSKQLDRLNCWGNQLKNLDLSQNTQLSTLWSWDNKLESLDLRGIQPSEGKKRPYVFIINQVERLREADKSITALKIIKINDRFKEDDRFNNQLKYIKEKNPKLVISTYNAEGKIILENYNPLAAETKPETKKAEKSESTTQHLVDITDNNFRAYLKKTIPNAFPDGGEQMNANHSSVKELDKISVSNKGIKTLKGIEYFTGLKKLFCSKNQLTSLDLSKNTALNSLYCSDNQLTSLNIAGCKALTGLYCYNNKLTTLNVSANTALTNLSFHDNDLKSLDLSQNTALTYLNCYNNSGLTTLDLSKHPDLKYLTLTNSKDASNLPSLTTLKIREEVLANNYLKTKLIEAKKKKPAMIIELWNYSEEKGCYRKCSDYDVSKGACNT